MLVGFHVEGNDHLIFKVLLSKLLDISEEEIDQDLLDGIGRGDDFVFRLVPQALRRFYSKGAQLALIGVDNDGRPGSSKSPRSKLPRHWEHQEPAQPGCRFCRLQALVEHTRRELTWLVPPDRWPIVVAVPVEAMEAWLLTALALMPSVQRRGLLDAEERSKDGQKQMFYGRPAATLDDVEQKALPLLRAMTSGDFERLQQHSRSFRQFADQVASCKLMLAGGTVDSAPAS